MAVALKYGGKQKKDSFLMFSAAWVDEKGPQRVLGFALHALTRLLKYKGLVLFVDATFDGAPKGFYQVLIFSVMDDATNMCTPIFLLSYDYKKRTGLQHHLDEHTIMHW